VETKYILDKIKVKRVNQQTLHHYKLEYDLDFYPRMKHVWLYKGDTETEFINPTTIEWGGVDEAGFVIENAFTGIDLTWQYGVDHFFPDINGDGLSDRLSVYYYWFPYNVKTNYAKQPKAWWFNINNGDGTFSDNNQFIIDPVGYFSHILTGDFNGDGLSDFVYVRFLNEMRSRTIVDLVAFSNGNGFDFRSFSNDAINPSKAKHPIFNVGDFDGNGISELILVNRNSNDYDNVFVYKFSNQSNPKELILQDFIDVGNTVEEDGDVIIGDFDGDGKSDLLRTAEYGGNPHTSNCFIYRINLLSENAEYMHGTESNGYPTTWHQIYPGDFNGDGITDILTYNSTAQEPEWEIGLFNGFDDFMQIEAPQLGRFNLLDENDSRLHTLSLNDFNADGFTDILHTFKGATTDPNADYSLFFSSGSGFGNELVGSFSFNGPFQVTERNFVFNNVRQIMDFNGDGYIDFYLANQTTSYDKALLYEPDNGFNRIETIINGFGEKSHMNYKPLTDNTIYTKKNDARYPLMDIQPSLYVVHALEREYVNTGLTATNTYQYIGAKLHLQGKGFLGFKERKIHDSNSGLTFNEINGIDQEYYYLYNFTSETDKTNQKTIEYVLKFPDKKLNSYNSMVFFPFERHILKQKREYTSELYDYTNLLSFEYDDYGNVILHTVKSDSIQKWVDETFTLQTTTETQYLYDTDNWIFRPEETDTKVRYHSKTLFLNKTVYEYFPSGHASFPLLKSQKDHPEGNTNHEFTTQTDYTYDIYGNPTSVTLSAPHDPSSPAPRTTTMAYDAAYKHRLLTSTTNPLGYLSSYTYNDAYGWKLTETDPNGFETSFNPHPLGIESLTTLPDGSQQGAALRWANNHDHAPDNATYYSWQKQTGSAPSLVFYHKTGAELRRVSTGFDGSAIYTDTYYDENNRLHKTSLPYVKEDKKKYYTTYGYDDIGRTTMIEAPDGTRTINQYHKTTVTTTNALGQSSSREHNAAGWLTKSTDALGTEVNYSYFSDGKLHQTMISNQPNTLITLSYNSRRQRSTLSDPNYGLMQTTYNAFGELISQTTPRGHETVYTYDKLGRMTTRTETEGSTTWNYATAIPELGTLQSVENTTHNTTYTYDELLRPETIIENINGTAYTTNYTYDRNSRPQSITHPSGFTEQLSYNRHGYQHRISDAQTNKNLWQLLDQYPAGMTKRSATGNGTLLNYYSYNPETLRLTNSLVAKPDKTMIQEFGYDYDAIGNMAYRSKTLPGGQQLKEEFWYDQLNRLTDIKLNGQPTGGHSYDEDGLGNIEAKTADGQTLYNNAQYGEGTHGPHAITSAANTANAFPEEEQLAEYTSYEQLKSLTQGTLGLSIMYGHHHQRIRQKYWDEATETAILKLWAGSCEYITQNGQTTTLTYLSSPDGLYALHRILPDGSENIHYLHTDHLGSWTAVTNETGTIVDEQSYDAWGNRRNPATWSSYNYTPPEPQYDRGFTSHEHLDGFQLINMNGRMYDPVVSRMLAPDNFVQTPDFSQNFNRYSYALNNPLVYTDPSGEYALIDDLIVMGVGGLINLGVNALQGNINSWGDAGGYFLAGAAAAEVSIYAGPVAGGAVLGMGNDMTNQISNNGLENVNWEQAVFSGFMGGATAYVGGQITSVVSPHVSGLTSKITNSPVVQQALTQGVSNSASGFLLGTGVSKLNGNDWDVAISAGSKGALFGVGLGLTTGAISGYNYAQKNNLNWRNGESLSPKYDYTPDPNGNNITLYRGTTGSEGKGGPLFMTDDPNYASTYVKNGGSVVEVTIPRSTYMQMQFNGHIQTYRGIHDGVYGSEYQIHPSIVPNILHLFK